MATTGTEPVWEWAQRSCVVREAEPKGTLQVFVPRNDVCVTLARGHLSLSMAERWIDVIERHFDWGASFDTFHDWDEMVGYDSRARQALTSWVVQRFRGIRSAHFLVRDRLVRMGVTSARVATALVGLELELHSDRKEFESLLARLV